MKKLRLLVMSLMAVYPLVSCGESKPAPDPEPVGTATLSLNDNSQQYGKLSYEGKTDYTIDISDCINNDNFTINFAPEEAYKNANFQIVLSDANFTATYNNKVITIDGTRALQDGDNLVITLNDKWYEDETYLSGLDSTDIKKENPDGSVGEVKALIVNGLRHKVRLIGVDEDFTDVAKQNSIHTTWEFINLISDENGYSLATQWNDTNNLSAANHKYTESTIRHALNGENVDDVLWAQKEATTWSSNYKCSVLDMLNEGNPGFGDSIKKPIKYYNEQKKPESGWEEQTINDKLFLLSPVEMGRKEHTYEETKTTTYSYYNDAKKEKRIKKQIEGATEYKPNPAPTIPNGDKQTYKGEVYNYAGYNYKVDATGGGYSWLRSPYTNTSSRAWYVEYDGIVNHFNVYYTALGVSPAFCI